MGLNQVNQVETLTTPLTLRTNLYSLQHPLSLAPPAEEFSLIVFPVPYIACQTHSTESRVSVGFRSSLVLD
ncbi:hypothetical protein J4Q44_G00068120 [Coregonus suidteri]|uniref:Uncharacterized protein n=1 Tax=Coregonus suidteri TaxID=861788 RepID=A0AAN8LZX6_9TELE